MNNLRLSIVIGGLLGMIHGAAHAVPVTPNFTSGTVTSRTESTTTITESIRQTDFQTGWVYTATGTNIDFQGTPQVGANYTLITPGAAFQFSESYLGPGQSRFTEIDRTTTMSAVTESLSVFTQ